MTLTKVVASNITPKRFVLFAKLTASLTLRHRKSVSSSCGARTSDGVPLREREIPQYEAKKTATGGQLTLFMIHVAGSLCACLAVKMVDPFVAIVVLTFSKVYA